MRKIRIWAVLLAMTLLLSSCAAAADVWDITKVVYAAGEIETTEAEKTTGLPIFVITMKDGSVMRGELYPDIAPQAVGNFVALANSGYYDGLIFHRVIPGFMIQGGDILGNGTGGPGWVIKGEFAQNGVKNDLKHTTGVLSMARRSQPMDSAGSQFFVMVADAASLDGGYAAFGKVLTGMETAMAIVGQKRDANDKPATPQVMASIRVETFGKEYPFDKK